MTDQILETVINLRQLRREFDEHKSQQDERWEKLLSMVEENTRATSELAESTRGVVKLYHDFHGAIRVGIGVQSFCLWLTKWGVIGSATAAAIMYIAKHWGPGG